MQILTTIALIIIGILLFELIIFSHEMGHFITAKLSGIKVNEFSLGMGPRIFGFTKGETAYNFRLFPIGGFCAMEGEDEDSLEPRAFNNAKIWKRMIIIIAGAVMNIILGLLLMFIFVAQASGFSSTTVSEFTPNSFSANSGLEAGDQIVDVGGYSIWNSRDLQFALASLKTKDFDGKSIEVYKQDCANSAYNVYAEVVSNKDNNISESKNKELYEELTQACSQINLCDSKESAKKYLDDFCTKLYKETGIKDYKLPTITEKDKRTRFSSDIAVIRNGKQVNLKDVQFFTYYATQEDKDKGKMSVALDFYVEPIEKNVGTVISQTFSQTGSMVKMVWTSLAWLVQGRFGFTDLSGPVGIASAVTQVASQGLQTSFGTAVNNILFVMILITVNLGVVNMLPFPALDGGRFLFLLIEGIFRKPIPRKVEQYVNGAGLALLMLFMIVITFKDIWQLIFGGGIGG